MCTCIDKIEKEQLSSVSRSTGKRVTSFEFTEDALGHFMNMKNHKDLGIKTKSTCRYTLEGQKKVYRSFMHHNYCPFCGKKY